MNEREKVEYSPILHAARSKEHHEALELKSREARIQAVAERILITGNVSASGALERAEEFETLCEKRFAVCQKRLHEAANALQESKDNEPKLVMQ